MLAYDAKCLGVVDALRRVRDARVRPRIRTEHVVLPLFTMALSRLGSLNALEQTARSAGWSRLIGGRLPSADTLGRVASLLAIEDIRSAHAQMYSRLKRNKALPAPRHGLVALAVDGHESTASYRRCCAGCLERTIHAKDGDRTQYYHRYVAASLVGEDYHHFLGIEEVLAGEDEVAAALRLVRRLHATHPRAFDVVVGDSLYAQARFFHAVRELGKDVVAVLKQEARELHKDATALCELTAPVHFCRDRAQVTCWDLEDLTSWSSLGVPVRVVRTEETRRVRRQNAAPHEPPEELRSEWMWVTTLSCTQAPAAAVVQIGHARWDIENRGFNEAVNDWHADHVYRHEPRAMTAILLLKMLAVNVMSVFYRRGIKPARRAQESLRHVVRLVTACLYRTREAAARRGRGPAAAPG